MLAQSERRTIWRYVIALLAAVVLLIGPRQLTQLASARLLSGEQVDSAPATDEQLQRQTSQVEPESCGPVWRVVPSPNRDANENSLASISALSANDAWAVGYDGDLNVDSQTLIEHWDGTAWSIVPSPNRRLPGALRGVAAISARDAWAVGSDGQIGTESLTLIQHWDGTQWSIVDSPGQSVNGMLTAVAAVSSNDVWAVGSYYYDISQFRVRMLIMHWDGTEWSIVPTPDVDFQTSLLTGVSTTSASDVWAVGFSQKGLVRHMLILRWDGTQWSIVDSPAIEAAGSSLAGVAAVSATEAWAVGNYLDSSTNIERTLTIRWDGSQWEIIPSPNAPGWDNALSGVWASTTQVWAVGHYRDLTVGWRTLTEHWDGSQWTIVPGVDPSRLHSFSGVAVAPGGDVWAVGSAEYGSPPNWNWHTHALIERYNDPCSGCTLSFTDVEPGNTFYPYVMCMACAGIVSGYADGTFRPNSEVTRGQLAKILAGAAGFYEPVFGQLFTDVPPGHTFYAYIQRLADRYIISGYPCGGPGEPCVNGDESYFRPGANATRGQISKIVSNAARFLDEPREQTFEDVPPTHTFYREIQRLASRNIMGGYPCGGVGEPCLSGKPYFRPANNVTRGQSAKIVANTFYPGCDTP